MSTQNPNATLVQTTTRKLLITPKEGYTVDSVLEALQGPRAVLTDSEVIVYAKPPSESFRVLATVRCTDETSQYKVADAEPA